MKKKKLPPSFAGPALKLEIFKPGSDVRMEIPLSESSVSAGFPSPAEDYVDKKLDLNEYLVKRPSSTFFVRVSGQSMTGAGIHDGDLLIVDRAASVADNKIVIGVVNGDFTVKRIRKKGKLVFLQPENPSFKEIEITTGMDFAIWGVVVYVIHKL
ncbi:MAG TPA: translesion error-prone DNA polymerase V autoproteolytic subunit [Bacteroidia bacterium]|nr:translesion error-prone DNA polymerase V autoproteolytic subunit [Bacteroidia bacterium]